MFAVACALLSYEILRHDKTHISEQETIPLQEGAESLASRLPVVLAPCDYYLPGFKAGGPIQTPPESPSTYRMNFCSR